jgi:hypothetical protein
MPIDGKISAFTTRFRWLALAVLITATLQAVIIGRAYSIHVDGLTFIGIAQDFQRDPIGTMRVKDQHPGYPALVLAAASLARPCVHLSEPDLWTLATRVASGTCGILSVIVCWLFARRLFDDQVANITALSFAVLPLFRLIAADALSDTQHLLLYLLAAWLAAEGFARDQIRWFAAAGAASGAAFWVRPEGLEVALITGVLLACQMLLQRRLRAGVALVAVGAAAMIVIAPYIVLAGKITSKQLPWAKRQAVPVFVVTESQAAQREAQKGAPASAPLVAAPAAVSQRVAARVALKAAITFIKNIVWGFRFVFLPLYLIGNWELYRRRPAWWVVLLPACLGALHIAVLFGVYFISGYIDQRHVMPIVALGLPFAALGSIYVAEKLTALLTPRFSNRTVLATVVALSCAIVVPRDLVPMNPELQAVFVAAHWIRDQLRPGDAVISNSPYVAFYGDMPGAELTPETPTLESALARTQIGPNVEFAVLDLQINGFRPEWRTQIERDYREVFRLQDPRSDSDEIKLLVYRARHNVDPAVGSAEPADADTAGGDPIDGKPAIGNPAASAVPHMTATEQAGKL